MLSWVSACLPTTRHHALLSSSGTDGYAAFRRSLEPGYPAHSILLTNLAEEDMCKEDDVTVTPNPSEET